MPFPFGDMYAFDKSIVSLVQWDKNEWILKLCFNTKWAPPEDFYRWLVKQPWVLFFYANYCEPGCQVLGEFTTNDDKELIDNFVWIPDSFNSSALDKEVFITEPHNLYYEFYDEDSRMTFEEYLKAIYDLGNQDTSLRDALTAECVQWAELLKINLEDQKWVELIADFENPDNEPQETDVVIGMDVAKSPDTTVVAVTKSYRIKYVGLIAMEVVFATSVADALSKAQKDLEVESVVLRY